MRAWLRATLAATLLASAGLALWPADTPDALLPAARPRPASAGMPLAAAPPVQPAAAAARSGGTAPAGAVPTGAAPAFNAPGSTPPLPTRPADWPAPSAAALAAWQGTPPPPARPAARAQPVEAAAAPAGPVFPYRWIGQLDDGGTPQVLLASAQRSVAVRLGATLDGRWRLQRSNSGVLQVQALPDGELQAVAGAPLAAQP